MAMLGHVFALGRLFSICFAFFSSSHLQYCFISIFHRFFSMLDRFLKVLGWFWEGFGRVVSMIVCIIIKNRDF